MESQAVRRRMDRIACHLTANEDVTTNQVLPMNCSSNLNSTLLRRDNRTLFARQSSISQACFMRQVSITQGNQLKQENENSFFINSGESMFARPAQSPPEFARPNTKFSREEQIVSKKLAYATSEAPKFARPNTRLARERQIVPKKPVLTSNSSGMEWSPRMDVAESGRGYVVTVELPGVSIKGIRVEVDDQNLIVTGKRSIQWRGDAYHINDSTPTYHRREILQGPYQVVWLLPSDINKDDISAEFVGGFLQIMLPKL